MDTTITALHRDLSRKLVEVGRRLDTTKNPEEMKDLISQRKRLQASMGVTEDCLARLRVGNLTRIMRDEPTPPQGPHQRPWLRSV